MGVKQKPDFTKPVDILAFFDFEFGACGCSDLGSMFAVVRDLLAWIDGPKNNPPYHSLYSSIGVYYLLVGLMDDAGLCEHGVSIRVPFLTENGKALLKALRTIPFDEIENSNGTAYNECYYRDSIQRMLLWRL